MTKDHQPSEIVAGELEKALREVILSSIHQGKSVTAEGLGTFRKSHIKSREQVGPDGRIFLMPPADRVEFVPAQSSLSESLSKGLSEGSPERLSGSERLSVNELVRNVSYKLSASQEHTDRALTALAERIQEEVAQDGRSDMEGFGVFLRGDGNADRAAVQELRFIPFPATAIEVNAWNTGMEAVDSSSGELRDVRVSDLMEVWDDAREKEWVDGGVGGGGSASGEGEGADVASGEGEGVGVTSGMTFAGGADLSGKGDSADEEAVGGVAVGGVVAKGTAEYDVAADESNLDKATEEAIGSQSIDERDGVIRDGLIRDDADMGTASGRKGGAAGKVADGSEVEIAGGAADDTMSGAPVDSVGGIWMVLRVAALLAGLGLIGWHIVGDITKRMEDGWQVERSMMVLNTHSVGDSHDGVSHDGDAYAGDSHDGDAYAGDSQEGDTYAGDSLESEGVQGEAVLNNHLNDADASGSGAMDKTGDARVVVSGDGADASTRNEIEKVSAEKVSAEDVSAEEGSAEEGSAEERIEGEVSAEVNGAKGTTNGTMAGLMGGVADVEAGGYCIVLFSLTNEARADRMIAELGDQGFKTAKLIRSTEDGTLYRVAVGQFLTVEEAQEAAGLLPEPYRSNHFVTRME